jgi:hypothetical protein
MCVFVCVRVCTCLLAQGNVAGRSLVSAVTKLKLTRLEVLSGADSIAAAAAGSLYVCVPELTSCADGLRLLL